MVDRDFDVSYHLRWIAAPQPKTLDTVLEYARQSAMSGLDRDRPLWSFTVVEGLDGGRAAVVVKLHHVLTDGTGGYRDAPFVVDTTRTPGDLGPMPAIPDDNLTSYCALALDALAARRAMRTFLRARSDLPREVLPEWCATPSPRRTLPYAISGRSGG